MEEEDVPSRAASAGARLTKALEGTPGVESVRGLGLLLAAELTPDVLAANDGGAKGVQIRLLEAGLVVNAVTATALRFAPPLLVSDDEIDEAIAIVAKVLA